MTVRLAMTYSEIGVTEVESLIDNPNIAVEQKVDGSRSLCVVKKAEGEDPVFIFLGRNGGALKHTAAMQWFEGIKTALTPLFMMTGETVLDGEIMIDSGEFIVYDLPYMQVNGKVVSNPEMPYGERRQILGQLLAWALKPVCIGGMATTPEAKRDLFARVHAEGGEGVMLKRLDSVYEPGKRTKHSVKAKFVSTADVVVTSAERGRNEAGREIGSCSFAVNDGIGGMKALGACSLIGKPEVKVGDVIEVAYLSYFGGYLVQPRMRRVRTDKTAAECDLSQLRISSKAVLV